MERRPDRTEAGGVKKCLGDQIGRVQQGHGWQTLLQLKDRLAGHGVAIL